MKAGSVAFLSIAVVVVMLVVGCTTGTGTQPQGGSPPAPAGGAATARLAGGLDLTNRNSPLAASYSGGSSQTILQPGKPPVGLLSVAGGGDTVSALNKAGVGDDFSFVSTAGGAFLEWMEGKALPGVEILRKR